MSLWRDELKASRATLACLIALAAVSVASMSRVIESGYLVWAVGALVVGSLFALSFGQRSLGVGFGLLVALSALTLPALFLRDTTSGLLPTPSAFSAVRKLLAAGFAGIAKDTPPVAALPKYTILVWLSFLLLGFLGAAWVVVRRPVGAVVSALAVITFTGSVGEGAGRNAYAIASIATAGAFFLAEGRHRISRWGGGRISIPAWLGMPTLLGACAIAIAAPIVLGETPIVKLDSPIRPRVVIIKPLSDIKRQLKVDPPLEVMRVSAERPTYWRLTGLDSYDGREWVLEARPKDVRNGIVPDAKPAPTGAILEQTYRLTSLLSPWLPAAYAAKQIDTEAAVQVDDGSQTLLLRDKTQPGLTYTVVSQQSKVTQNLEVEPQDTSDELADVFKAFAQRVVGNARTPLDKARRLEAHFRTYTYNEDVPAGHTIARLQQFLKDKTGYCEQFAATMTLMLRALGVEARVGVGFLPGSTSGSSGEYVVSTRDAHAWVEANIPVAGWTSFDPTPGRGQASVSPPQLQEQQETPVPIPQVTAVPEPTPQQQNLPDDVTGRTSSGRFLLIALYVLLGIVVVGAIPSAKAVRRSRRRRGPPGAVVVGAYSELLDNARDLGWRSRPSETQREFAARTLGADQSGSSLAVLTDMALYSTTPVERAEATTAWTALTSARTTLRRKTPSWRQTVAVFDPRTFLPERWADRFLERLRIRRR